MDREELSRRHNEAARLAAEERRRRQLAHDALFADVIDREISSVLMPLSQWVFQWRNDGYYRVQSQWSRRQDEDSTEEDDWDACTGERSLLTSKNDDFYMMWGQCEPSEAVTCSAADGTTPSVVRLGWLWIVEHEQPTMLLTVTAGPDTWY